MHGSTQREMAFGCRLWGETVRKPQWRVTDGHDEFSDSLGGCCKMESLFHIELPGKTCYTMDRRKGA